MSSVKRDYCTECKTEIDDAVDSEHGKQSRYKPFEEIYTCNECYKKTIDYLIDNKVQLNTLTSDLLDSMLDDFRHDSYGSDKKEDVFIYCCEYDELKEGNKAKPQTLNAERFTYLPSRYVRLCIIQAFDRAVQKMTFEKEILAYLSHIDDNTFNKLLIDNGFIYTVTKEDCASKFNYKMEVKDTILFVMPTILTYEVVNKYESRIIYNILSDPLNNTIHYDSSIMNCLLYSTTESLEYPIVSRVCKDIVKLYKHRLNGEFSFGFVYFLLGCGLYYRYVNTVDEKDPIGFDLKTKDNYYSLVSYETFYQHLCNMLKGNEKGLRELRIISKSKELFDSIVSGNGIIRAELDDNITDTYSHLRKALYVIPNMEAK